MFEQTINKLLEKSARGRSPRQMKCQTFHSSSFGRWRFLEEEIGQKRHVDAKAWSTTEIR